MSQVAWVKAHKVWTGLIIFVVLGLIGSVGNSTKSGDHTPSTSAPASRPATTAPNPAPKPPLPLHRDPVAVSRLVADTIKKSGLNGGLSGHPETTCANGFCSIRYALKEPGGIDTDVELLEPQRPIWKALFADPRFTRGSIEVDGPLSSVGGKRSVGAYLTLSCDRAASNQIDWDNVDGKGLRTLCTYTPMAKGV